LPGSTRPRWATRIGSGCCGGRTIAEDLHPRCQPHHNGKTHPGWATGTGTDGTRYTRSPLRFDYTLEPDPYLETG
jgi:hypothetical protein